MADPNLSQVVVATDTFGSWIIDFNATVADLQTNVITTALTASGGLTTGNAFVNGIFSANILATSQLSGGNVQSVANLTITTNTIIGNSTVNVFIGNATINISGQAIVINTAGINVGSNVYLNTSKAFLGNSTVNTVINSSSISTLNVFVGSNITVNTSTHFAGNSTVNAFINSTTLELQTAGNTLFANSSDISISANIVINTSTYFVGNSSQNAVVNSTGFFLNGSQSGGGGGGGAGSANLISQATSGTGSQIIDSFLLNTYRSAEYVLQITDLNNNNYQISKLIVLQSGGVAQITEYAIVVSNTAMGGFTIGVNSTAAIINLTPVSSSALVKGWRLPISV